MGQLALGLLFTALTLMAGTSISRAQELRMGPPTVAEEGRCGLVNISRDPRLLPHQDQGSMGWCFAMAAANLLSFQEGERVSASDLALEPAYASATQSGVPFRVPQMGSVEKVLEFAMQNGYCAYENAPSLQKEDPLVFYELMRDPTFYSIGMKQMFPNAKISRSLNPANFDVELRNAHAAACGERKSLKNKYQMRVDKSDLAKQLTSLDRKEPAILQVDVKKIFNQGEGFHSMLLVGRRWNPATNKCDYLVKNTWDVNCANIVNPRVKCDNEGNTLIPADILIPGIAATVQLIKEGRAATQVPAASGSSSPVYRRQARQ